MARFGAGVCADADVVKAAERAAAEALDALGGRTPDLVCFFICSPDADDFALGAARVADITRGHAVLGCSGAGVLGPKTVVESFASVSVWAALLPGSVVRTFHLEVMSVDDGLAVIGLPERRDDDEVAILLAEPHSFPADSFVDRLNAQMAGLPVVGGVAATPVAGGQPMLFHDGRCVDRGAVGAFLGGPVAARAAVAQGCRAVGPAMVVTGTERNVLLSLAGLPAAAKLEEIVSMLPADEQALASQELLLGIVIDEYADEHDSGDFVVRRILGTDDATGGVFVAGVVALGTSVRLHVPDAGAAGVHLASVLASLIDGTGFDQVEGVLLFSAQSRSGLFATDDHEIAAVGSMLGSPAVAGLLTAGEVGPAGGRNWLHSSALAILAFGSGPAAARGTRQPPT
jgi:small ligand-binding sensory domain FIST